MKKLILIIIFINSLHVFSQVNPDVKIGIITDEISEETLPLFQLLENEIKAVVGQDAQISFLKVLSNDFNLEKAKRNYNTLINNDSDIILAFGMLSNLVVTQQTKHVKPTILFGAINKDLFPLNEEQSNSGINNFTYLVTSQSYKNDVVSFKELVNFKNLGVLVKDFAPKELPIKDKFQEIANELAIDIDLLPYDNIQDIYNRLNQFEAIYIADGFFLTDEEIKNLSNFFIDNKIPSFTSTHIGDVEAGILATNQSDENLSRFFRRIALDVEAIINGQNASELSTFLEYNNKLTVNYGTAERIGVPIKYSLIASIEFVAGSDSMVYDKKYSLLDVMNETIENNLSLASSRKGVLLQEQEIKSAKSNYLPSVTASATGSYLDPKIAELSQGSNPEYKTSGAITLNQTIYSEAANANISIQENLTKAEQENYNTDLLDAIFNTSTLYFNTLILKTNVQIQSENLEVTKKNLQIAEQNYEAGQSSKTDLLRFKSEKAQNTQTFVEAINQLEQTFYSLNQLLNNDITYKIDVDDAELSEGIFEQYNYQKFGALIDDPSLRIPFVEFLVEEAINNAPEISSLDYNLKATQRNLKLNSSGRFVPTLGLQAQYNKDFNQWGKGSTPTPIYDDNYNVGINISIPLIDQNVKNINRQTAIIQQDQLNINKDNVKLNIEKNINDAVLEMVNQISNIELSRVSEETAKESLDLTQTSYTNGAVTITQLIDAQRNYLQAQLSKANATYNYLIASIQLERYLGHYFLLKSDAENEAFIERFSSFLLSRN